MGSISIRLGNDGKCLGEKNMNNKLNILVCKNFEKELGTSVHIGISIHTGEVVVGNIGFEKKMDYTVIGDAVNTVFRMQEYTKSYPNGIIIGENTKRSVGNGLKVRKINKTLGKLKLYELLDMKNVSEEIEIFKL